MVSADRFAVTFIWHDTTLLSEIEVPKPLPTSNGLTSRSSTPVSGPVGRKRQRHPDLVETAVATALKEPVVPFFLACS